jgi:hypothetical protein
MQGPTAAACAGVPALPPRLAQTLRCRSFRLFTIYPKFSLGEARRMIQRQQAASPAFRDGDFWVLRPPIKLIVYATPLSLNANLARQFF